MVRSDELGSCASPDPRNLAGAGAPSLMRIVLPYFYPRSRRCVTPDDFFIVESVDRFQDSTVGIIARTARTVVVNEPQKSAPSRAGWNLIPSASIPARRNRDE